MEFDGEFELEDVSPKQAWIVLSDPIAVRNALKGCRYIAPKDEDFEWDSYEPEENAETLPEADIERVAERAFEEGREYAALMQVGVGSVKPKFETTVTIDERDEAVHRMTATGSGSASDSSFSMESGMQIDELDDGEGSRIEWWAETDISGRIAQLGGRVIDPVATKIVTNFFTAIESEMSEVEESDVGVTDRIRGMF